MGVTTHILFSCNECNADVAIQTEVQYCTSQVDKYGPDFNKCKFDEKYCPTTCSDNTINTGNGVKTCRKCGCLVSETSSFV